MMNVDKAKQISDFCLQMNTYIKQSSAHIERISDRVPFSSTAEKKWEIEFLFCILQYRSVVDMTVILAVTQH